MEHILLRHTGRACSICEWQAGHSDLARGQRAREGFLAADAHPLSLLRLALGGWRRCDRDRSLGFDSDAAADQGVFGVVHD